jgi:hypothetical protein
MSERQLEPVTDYTSHLARKGGDSPGVPPSY